MSKPIAPSRRSSRRVPINIGRLKRTRSFQEKDELLQLRNIGKAMRQDFDLLKISNIAQLAKQDADKLYARIQTLTGARHDPCVWDTYAAAIHQARTGEALPWWHFTRVRKELQNRGSFMVRGK
ncbi:MAG: helix-hairpin-helix domain-containing protein [Steroidobacter sp.]